MKFLRDYRGIADEVGAAWFNPFFQFQEAEKAGGERNDAMTLFCVRFILCAF